MPDVGALAGAEEAAEANGVRTPCLPYTGLRLRSEALLALLLSSAQVAPV